MLILQSLDRFDDLALFDPRSGYIEWVSKRSQSAPVRIKGHAARIDGSTLCLYRAEDEILHFRLDRRDIPLEPGVVVEWARSGERNTIAVLNAGTELLKWTYRRPKVEPPLEMDPTPFVEEEDFDFGLFVHNVTHDAGRRERIYTDPSSHESLDHGRLSGTAEGSAT